MSWGRESCTELGNGNPRREGVGAFPFCSSSFVSSSLLSFGLFAFSDNMQKQLFAHQKAEQFYRICGKFQMLPNEKLSTCNLPAGIPFPFCLFSLQLELHKSHPPGASRISIISPGNNRSTDTQSPWLGFFWVSQRGFLFQTFAHRD